MEALETQLTSVGSTTAVLIPEEMLTPLGLHQGSRITLAMRDGQIILSPSASEQQAVGKGPDLLDAAHIERRLRLAETPSALRGIFASDRDLVAELQQERRQDKW